MKKILLIIFSMFILINVNAEEKTELDEYAKNRVDSCITAPFTGSTITCGNTIENLNEYIEYLSYSCVKDVLDQGYSKELDNDIVNYVYNSNSSFIENTASFCEQYRKCNINYYRYMKAISDIKNQNQNTTIDYLTIYKKYFNETEAQCLSNNQMHANYVMVSSKESLQYGYENYTKSTSDNIPETPSKDVNIGDDKEDLEPEKSKNTCETKYSKDKITTVKTIIAAIRISLLVAGIVISIIKLLPILRDRYEGMIIDIVKIVIVFVIILVIVLMIPLIVKLFGGSCFI